MKTIKPSLMITLSACVTLSAGAPVFAHNGEGDGNQSKPPTVTTNVKPEKKAKIEQVAAKPECEGNAKVIPIHQLPVERRLNRAEESIPERQPSSQTTPVKAKVATNAAKAESKAIHELSAEERQGECGHAQADGKPVKVIPIGRLPVENAVNKQKKDQKKKGNN